MLSKDREANLDALGFVWDQKEAAWDTRFVELKRCKDKHGDCNVPARWVENPELATWVNTQRTVANSGKLTPVRKARLDGLGFAWHPEANKRPPVAK
jgi:Helicase associated domain